MTTYTSNSSCQHTFKTGLVSWASWSKLLLEFIKEKNKLFEVLKSGTHGYKRLKVNDGPGMVTLG